MLDRLQSTKGFKVVANTTATAVKFYGFTVISDAVVSAIVAPTSPGPENITYSADTSGLPTHSLPAGYYPIRGSSITLTSGKIILWLE